CASTSLLHHLLYLVFQFLLICFYHMFFLFFFFFFNDTATTEIYTLSLHDALPISMMKLPMRCIKAGQKRSGASRQRKCANANWRDRKSTRLNSSHVEISYAVFCLKKKKKKQKGKEATIQAARKKRISPKQVKLKST